MRTLIGIDPGASGAIVARLSNGELVSEKMPATCRDILDVLREMLYTDPRLKETECTIENVGGYRPGNSGPAACKFARHCGTLEMALIALEIPHTYVAPSVWMRAVLKTVPKEKTARKNAIKAEMQRRYPKLKITLANSDALGILTFAMEKEG